MLPPFSEVRFRVWCPGLLCGRAHRSAADLQQGRSGNRRLPLGLRQQARHRPTAFPAERPLSGFRAPPGTMRRRRDKVIMILRRHTDPQGQVSCVEGTLTRLTSHKLVEAASAVCTGIVWGVPRATDNAAPASANFFRKPVARRLSDEWHFKVATARCPGTGNTGYAMEPGKGNGSAVTEVPSSPVRGQKRFQSSLLDSTEQHVKPGSCELERLLPVGQGTIHSDIEPGRSPGYGRVDVLLSAVFYMDGIRSIFMPVDGRDEEV